MATTLDHTPELRKMAGLAKLAAVERSLLRSNEAGRLLAAVKSAAFGEQGDLQRSWSNDERSKGMTARDDAEKHERGPQGV